jgi:putative transposase
MARTARVAPGGLVYHVLNRSAAHTKLFRSERDYEAFERVMLEAHAKHPLRVLAWCVMPTHWHFVVWPERDGEVTSFFRWLAHTHAMRWRVARRTVGYGPLYQGRFKSFPIQRDDHLLTVCRYVERNALTAGLTDDARAWRWGSLWAREHGAEALRAMSSSPEWPVRRRADWAEHVNAPVTAKEVDRVRVSIRRGRPFGDERWVVRTAEELELAHTLRPEGRPPKASDTGRQRGGGGGN